MINPELGPVIAEGVLTYVDPVDGARGITVKLGAPQKLPDEMGWYAPWQIVGVGEEHVRYAVGVDAFQALQLVMYMIGATLFSQVQLQGVKLYWLDGEDTDLGFPHSMPGMD